MLTKTRQITLMDEQEQICMEIIEGMSAMIEGLKAAVVLGAVAVEVEAHPRPRVRKVTVANSFAERWSKNPDHYRDYYDAEEVEIKK